MTAAPRPARIGATGRGRVEAPGPVAVADPASIDAALGSLVGAPPPLLAVIDFDGTLSVGSRDPGVAMIEPGARRGLRAVARVAAERPGRVHVVVLTGRVVRDVVARVRVGGVEYLGDHGLEHGRLPRRGRPASLRVTVDPAWDAHRDPAEALAAAVPAELGQPAWLFVERKGPSVAFHVRQADDVVAARAAVVAAIGAVEARLGLVHDLAHYRGRSVVDLRPRDAGGKREAVERLVARHRPGAIVAFGDELSDIDAFEAVAAARSDRSDRSGGRGSSARSGRSGLDGGAGGAGAGGSGIVGITVAVHGATRPAPAELLAVADLAVTGPRDVGRMLAAIARRI